MTQLITDAGPCRDQTLERCIACERRHGRAVEGARRQVTPRPAALYARAATATAAVQA